MNRRIFVSGVFGLGASLVIGNQDVFAERTKRKTRMSSYMSWVNEGTSHELDFWEIKITAFDSQEEARKKVSSSIKMDSNSVLVEQESTKKSSFGDQHKWGMVVKGGYLPDEDESDSIYMIYGVVENVSYVVKTLGSTKGCIDFYYMIFDVFERAKPATTQEELDALLPTDEELEALEPFFS